MDDYKEELYVLNQYLSLLNDVSKIDKKIKETKAELDKKIIKKYGELSVDEIEDIIVNDKWLTVLTKNIEEQLDGISQILNAAIVKIARRYEFTMPKIEMQVEKLEGKVEEHLKRMGYQW